jgi:hypothetical protein
MPERSRPGYVDPLFDFSKRDFSFHTMATVVTGNALNRTVNTNQAFNSLTYQNTAANGDVFTNGLELRPGTYSFYVLGAKTNISGIIDWYLDDVAIVTGQDWYNVAAAVYNQLVSVASIAVGNTRYHTLRGVINGKNASSTDYFMLLTAYWFSQAAD